MKRFTAALAIALAAVCAAGAAPRVVITHFHWSGGSLLDGIVESAAAEFMAKNPDVQVKTVILPDDKRMEIIRAVLASGRPIDSFGLVNGESPQFLAADQMVQIIPASFGRSSVDDVAAMWTPRAIDICGGSWDGHSYGVPFELSNYVAWVNTADMREAGLDPARDNPRTWDQFVEVALKLRKVQGGATVRNGFMCNSKAGVFNFLVLLSMMEQLGLDWGSEKGLAASMDQPSVLARGLKTYTDFVTASRIWDPALYDEDRAGFGYNKASMFLTAGSWYWGLLKALKVPGENVRPFPYPRFPGGRDIGGVGYGYCLYVSRRAADPALCFRFLDALASHPNEFVRLGYYQPRVRLSDGTQALDPALARQYIPYYDQVFKPELARTAVWLHSTKGEQVIAGVWAAISRVIYQRESVDDSVAGLQADIRALFPSR